MTVTYAEASKALLHDTVLDAVSDLLADRTWAEVNMTEVAERAGVSRQTLYNSFGSRQALAQAYVSREAEGFLDTVADAVRGAGESPRAAIFAALEIFLAATKTHPLVRAISAADSGDQLLALVTVRGGPVVESVTTGLADLVVERWSGVPRREARVLADTMVRLGISHAALPAASPARTAAALRDVLGPYADSLVAAR